MDGLLAVHIVDASVLRFADQEINSLLRRLIRKFNEVDGASHVHNWPRQHNNQEFLAHPGILASRLRSPR